MVAGTDFRMAEDPVSPGRQPARVPRDHLPQLIHSNTRSAEKRADSAPSVQAPHTRLAALRVGGQSRGQIVDSRYIRGRFPLHPGKTRGNRRQRHSRSSGGRSPSGHQEQSHRDLVGATFAFYPLVKVPSKDTAVVVAALSRQVRRLPASLRRSLTWDRGLRQKITPQTVGNLMGIDALVLLRRRDGPQHQRMATFSVAAWGSR
jgi:hypothetical protein